MATENKPPSLYDTVEPESTLRVQNPGWPNDVSVRTLSMPTKELVGIFPQEVIDEVEGEPWMFTAAPESSIDDLAYLLGGDGEVVRVAFGETAARKGVVHRVDRRDIHVD